MNRKKEARPERVTKQRPGYDPGQQEYSPAAGSGQRPSIGEDAAPHQERLSLGELTEAADVSVRTVRYYIAEGLLPPPVGAGPGSWYTRGHLDRLRLIQQMKDAYLPLKEIRRQLAGLADAEVRALLAVAGTEQGQAGPLAAPPDASMAGAREYLALMETRGRYRTEPMALPTPPAPAPGDDLPADATFELAEPAVARRPLQAKVPQRARERDAESAGDEQGLWRRIALGPEAELVISDRVYARHRDRIDWLVRWARKVFD